MHRLEPAAPDDPLGVRRAILPNGLTVLLSRNPEQPRVFCRIVVRAGAAQEPRATTGLAHYLEHMLANKGTERLGTVDAAGEAPVLERIRGLYDALAVADADQWDALYGQICAQSAAAAPFAIPNELKQLHGRFGSRSLNAYTSHDQTSFVVDLPAGRLRAWAMTEADRFAAPVFRSFQTEVETVREEKKRSLDNASRQTFWAFMAALWGDHPYGTPVLGQVPHLMRPSLSAMRRFFATWYVPQNMAVVLSGDLDPEEAATLLAEHFGAWTPGTPPHATTAAPPLGPGERRVAFVHHGQPEVRLGWRTVSDDHPDRLALELLDRVLQNDGTGLLDRLGHTEQLRSCGCWHRAQRQGGYLCMWGRPRAGQTVAEVEALLLDAVATLRRGAIDPAVLTGILRNLEVDELAGLESNQGRTDVMAEAWLRGADPTRTIDELTALHALTVQDIMRVAERYLGADRVVVERSDGEPELPSMTAPPLPPLPAGAGGHSEFFATLLAAPSVPPVLRLLQEGRDWERAARDGVDVVRGQNPHVPIQRVTLRWVHGWERAPGLGTALRLWDRSGTQTLERPALEERLFALAAAVAISPGRHVTEVGITAPAETIADAMSLVRERLREPVITAADALRYVDDLVLRRAQARSTQEHAIQALSAYASRGEQSVFLQRPREAELREIARRGPGAWSRALEDMEVAVLATGPASCEELHRAMGPREGGAELPGVQDYARSGEDRILFVHHGSVQAQVTVYSPQGGYTPDDYGPRRLFAEVLGGAAGLVFQEVREKRGMAYSARGGLTSGWRAGDANLAWMQAGTQADKAADVAALLLELLRGFPVDAARLDRVRRSAVERRRTDRVGFKAVPATIVDWAGKGIHADPAERQLAELEATTDADVRGFAEGVAAAPVTIAVVGDRDQVDLAALRRLAPLTELTLDDITVG